MPRTKSKEQGKWRIVFGTNGVHGPWNTQQLRQEKPMKPIQDMWCCATTSIIYSEHTSFRRSLLWVDMFAIVVFTDSGWAVWCAGLVLGKSSCVCLRWWQQIGYDPFISRTYLMVFDLLVHHANPPVGWSTTFTVVCLSSDDNWFAPYTNCWWICQRSYLLKICESSVGVSVDCADALVKVLIG